MQVPLPPAANGAPNQKMKYGVISVHTLVDDLLHWRTMYVSGRMHKPVRKLFMRLLSPEEPGHGT